MSEPIRLAMWSGPRNISTAMMRAWENRPDTVVTDEPLYAHYLLETNVAHPGRNEVIAAQENDWRKVVDYLAGPVPEGKPVWYQKHMTQHVVGSMNLEWLTSLTNAFLVRRPEEVIASFSKQRPDLEVWEVGFERQVQLFDHVCQLTGEAPPVLEASDVLKNPEAVLRAFCARIGVEFLPQMLSWPAGSRDSDGVWAKHWYAAVEHSTGFAPWQPRQPVLTPHARRLADACRPHYEYMLQYRVSAA